MKIKVRAHHNKMKIKTHGHKEANKQTTQGNRYQPIPPQGISDIARGMGLMYIYIRVGGKNTLTIRNDYFFAKTCE